MYRTLHSYDVNINTILTVKTHVHVLLLYLLLINYVFIYRFVENITYLEGPALDVFELPDPIISVNYIQIIIHLHLHFTTLCFPLY